MPNTRSAAKRVRQSEKRHERNVAAKTEIRTYVKRCRAAIEAGQQEEALQLARLVESRLARAANKGIVHANNAQRRSGRLHQAISKAFSASE